MLNREPIIELPRRTFIHQQPQWTKQSDIIKVIKVPRLECLLIGSGRASSVIVLPSIPLRLDTFLIVFIHPSTLPLTIELSRIVVLRGLQLEYTTISNNWAALKQTLSKFISSTWNYNLQYSSLLRPSDSPPFATNTDDEGKEKSIVGV